VANSDWECPHCHGDVEAPADECGCGYRHGEGNESWNDKLIRASERALEMATAVIRKDGPKSKPYCVYSEKTGRKFGCYPTKKQAEKRLTQLHQFKKD